MSQPDRVDQDLAHPASNGQPEPPSSPKEISAFQIDKTGYDPDDQLKDLRAQPIPSSVTTRQEMDDEFGDLIPKESAPTPADYSASSSQTASSLPVLDKIVTAEEVIGLPKGQSAGQ